MDLTCHCDYHMVRYKITNITDIYHNSAVSQSHLPLVVCPCRLSLIQLRSLALVKPDYQQRDTKGSSSITLRVTLDRPEERLVIYTCVHSAQVT